jgi:hypothetical protein
MIIIIIIIIIIINGHTFVFSFRTYVVIINNFVERNQLKRRVIRTDPLIIIATKK